MTPEEKMARARVLVSRDAPYISSVLYGLVPYPVPGMRTMSTTEHMVLLYDPEWILTLSDDILAGIIFHECMHVLRDHIKRFIDALAGDEAFMANVAMDIAINPDIINAGWKLTPDALMPEMYGLPQGKTAEWYFIELRKLKQQPQKGKGKGKDGKGGEEKEGEGEGEGEGKQPGVCSGCCGGIAGNKGKSGEKEDKADAETGRSDAEQKLIIRATAEAIRKHAQQGRGRMPQSLIELAKALDEPPKVDWRCALAQVIRKATGRLKSGGQDFSLRRPSKRSYTRGILRPGLIQQLPEICIIRDTSGSMGQEQINAATRESIGIIQATGVDTIWFIDADAEVAFKKRVRIPELKELPVHGRGGTDFHPAIKALDTLKPRPDLTVYVTDGDGYAPPNPPKDMEFIWCVVPSYYKRRPAKWGHLVVVSESSIELNDALTRDE